MTQAIVQVFQNHEVRIVEIDGDVWWVAADVCKAIELLNPRQVLDRLDEDEKGVISMDTLGGVQKVNIINQYGLFSLILSSRKPSAKAFKRWVTHEVLPSIASKGSYSIPKPEPEPAQKSLPGTSLERWAELIRDLGYQESPLIKSALQQRITEELSGNANTNAEVLVLLTVRANQIGCPHSKIKDGSELGKYIKRRGFIPLPSKVQHGKYPANVYQLSPELDKAIIDYCEAC
jgi:prophage antirepressor-like protein